ncbi:MAG: polysaccharide pyruvyl transferase family protein [Rubricella sp.]
MKLNYFRCEGGNFGDDLNEWIWDRLLPGWRNWDPDVTLFGVGTLLNHRSISEYGDDRVLVLGSGVGYERALPLDAIPRNWDFRSVRGPRSARLLGLGEEKGLIDPAMMISEFPEFQGLERSDRPVFVPHHESVARHDWSDLCRRFGLRYMPPVGDAKTVIAEIARASLVIAESMHAAIIAESFRIPWIPVKIGPQFNAEKWIDFFESAGVDPSISSLFPIVDRVELMARAAPRLMPPRRIRERAGLAYERRHVARAFEKALSKKPIQGDAKALVWRKNVYRKILEDVRAQYA